MAAGRKRTTTKACLASIMYVLAFGSVSQASQDVKVIEAVNNFGINMYKHLSKKHENLICSGYSMSTVLTMLLMGAQQKTANEIRTALNYDAGGLAQPQIEATFQKLIKRQRQPANSYVLDIANSIWMQNSARVLPAFKSKIKNLFLASEDAVDFTSIQGTNKINDWVKKETHGKIPILFDQPLDRSTKLVLVNAVYFKGTWQRPFDPKETQPKPFNYANGQRNVMMMNTKQYFPYFESKDLEAQFLEMPYEGNEVSMVVVLPAKVDGLLGLQDILDYEKLNFALGQLKEAEVTVTIPKFESSSKLKMNDILQSLGIKNAFTPQADLSGITGDRNLYVSLVIQKALIELNEEGTVAAAASGIGTAIAAGGAVSFQDIFFTADHPFLYFILHKPTNIIVFFGSKTNP